MTLQWMAIILGGLATAGGLVGVWRPELIKRQAELFPRSVIPAWIFTALCCWLGAKEALAMNMGGLDVYKKYIYVISPAVFFAARRSSNCSIWPASVVTMMAVISSSTAKISSNSRS